MSAKPDWYDADVKPLRLGANGRSVIPAELRRGIGAEEGEILMAWTDGKRIYLARQDEAAEALAASMRRGKKKRRGE